jgi:hypothetical protein
MTNATGRVKDRRGVWYLNTGATAFEDRPAHRAEPVCYPPGGRDLPGSLPLLYASLGGKWFCSCSAFPAALPSGATS